MTKLQMLVIFICTMGLLQSYAQEVRPVISASFEGENIEQVVRQLELKTNLRFYLNTGEFSGLTFTCRAENITVDQFMEKMFTGTDVKYVIAGKSVYLTRNEQIDIGRSLRFSIEKGTFSIENKSDTGISGIPVASVMNKLYEIGPKTNLPESGNVLFSGYVLNARTGGPVPAALISGSESTALANTDQAGYFSIRLPAGKHLLTITAQGMQEARRQVMLYASGQLIFEIQQQSFDLDEVVISADKIRNVKAVELGVNRLDIKSIRQVPVVFGEADILRVVLTLPGVKSVGEASTGFNVRGGSTDQNLVLLNEIPVFSPSHFFGFFSAFNPDIVKDIELYKSSIPQKYGGRLSSVLEVTNREGNKDKFAGSAGIGLLTSRLNIEGPIDSGRTSFIFGGRTTYANWMLDLLPEVYKNSRASFYDFNLDVSHKINDRNSLQFSSYLSADKFKLNSDTSYGYTNKNAALKWRHVFNDKLYGSFIGSYSGYNYTIQSESNPVNAYRLFFGVGQVNGKADFSYVLNRQHTIDFGLNTSYYGLSPGEYTALGRESLVNDKALELEKALETAIYIGDRFDLSPRLSFNIGARYSIYNYIGKKTINFYAPGLPLEPNNQTGTKVYGPGQVAHTYHYPEIRASFRYSLSNTFSVKGGYNTLNQYIHLLSNSTTISPTDIWKLSDPNIRPQRGNQLSFGLYQNNKAHTIEFSAEAYYKSLKDYLDYKSGATLVLNDHIETDVVRTEGRAYGAEFMIKKTAGSLNGWLSYTYSRTQLRMTDGSQGELINNGAYYPGNADKPHDFNFTGNYKFTHRYSLSVNVAYSTGRPITLPIAKYEYKGTVRVLYSDRNQYRIPDYFRTDVSINIEGNHKVKQRTHNFWTLGVYNVTGRQNAYSAFFASEAGAINGYKLSIFASAIPFINYNIRF